MSTLSSSSMRHAYATFVSLCLLPVTVTAWDKNPLGIDWTPAPAPQDGPPLSAGASRNLSILPAQIGAIVGAYVAFVLAVGLAVLFVGRRLRASAQSSQRTLDVEMVKPINTNLGPSPISPEDKKAAQSSAQPRSPPPNYVSSTQYSPAPNFSWPSPKKESFSAVDERVVEEDRARGQQDMERLYAAVMEQDEAKAAGKQLGPHPELLQPAQGAHDDPAPHLHSPTKLLRKSRKPSPPLSANPPTAGNSPTLAPASRVSVVSSKAPSQRSSIASTFSIKSKRKGVRGLNISAPIPTPTPSLHSRVASTDEPLTPLMPPPSPPTHQRQPSQNLSAAQPVPPQPPSTSHTPTSPATASIDGELHTYHAHRVSNNTSANTARSSPKPLPFRNYAGASSDTIALPTSPRLTETVLERPRPKDSTRMNTAGTSTTPYSPYMPFSPITPITPRLVTKSERKAKAKAEGREVVKELCRDEKDLWDVAY